MIIEHIISYLAPHACISCRTEGPLLCQQCIGALPNAQHDCYRCGATTATSGICADCRPKTPLASVTARTTYQGLAKDLLWKLKFDRAVAAAVPIALACAAIAPTASSDLIITHVPTATNRVRQRGYDQSWHVARNVAKYLGKPAYPLLGRVGTARQVGADAATRKTQLGNAFRPRNSRHTANAHILLIDDVITTGASLEAAANILHSAGASRIDALVFAQATSLE